MRRAVFVLALVPILSAAASAREVRFNGSEAASVAGRYITDAIAYDSDYDPGRVAVAFVAAYQPAFITPARFVPSLGHQVVLSKGPTEPGRGAGERCAGFRVSIERFTPESLAELTRRPNDAVLAVASVDTVFGSICIAGGEDVRVDIEAVELARAGAGRNAFADPYAAVGGGGGF